ncbi:MAG TPA: acyl dehydratase [Nocardioides sp.]
MITDDTAGAGLAARGPYFDELEHGMVFDGAPGVTLTEGGAAMHQAVVGDRLPAATDHELGRRLTGSGPLAHPAYVWDVCIGQSTTATHFVKANLFYRGLAFRRLPALGDTLFTTTTVVGLKQNTPREGRALTGLAALHIITRDQEGRAVLDFHRCAMLPLTPGAGPTVHGDDLSRIGTGAEATTDAELLDGLDLAALTSSPALPAPGTTIRVVGGDVVSSAPELARLTLNVAQVHHDAHLAGGRRLVYGGHTIGIAAAQASRALPGIAFFLSWTSCDHTGPVHEGDTLRSTITVESVRPGPAGTRILDLRSVVEADAPTDGKTSSDPRPVLDWHFTVLAGPASQGAQR